MVNHFRHQGKTIMLNKKAADLSERAPQKGDVLMMEFTSDRVPFFRREQETLPEAVGVEFGRRLTVTHIPERLQFLFEVAPTESLIYVKCDGVDDASDDQLLLQNGRLVHFYDFVFADEDHEIRAEVMDRLSHDELVGLTDQLYGKHPMPVLHRDREAAL